VTVGALDGRKVVVIGGSAGMGLGIAEAAVDEGAEVAIAARGLERLEEAATRLERRGGRAVVRRALEIEDRSALLEFFEEFSPFDHMALPGSTVPPVAYGDLTEDIARVSFDSKFWGPFWAVFDGRSHMRTGGSVVFFSGVASQRPVPGYVVGACINGALEAATRSLALELGAAGLRINTISPGFIMTPLFEALHDPEDIAARLAEAEARLPVGRVGTPAEAASAAMMFMTNGFITGQVLTLDGGLLSTY
jgi:NAD(P)-dependent dehydrogenase (short-subunit alcohol dehydrogenase family)